MVAAETLAQLKHPFERGATGAKGSGLGLAIAEAIANGSGARLELLSPIPGQSDGFEARFHLPEFSRPHQTARLKSNADNGPSDGAAHLNAD